MSLFAGIATGPEAGSAAVYAAHSGLFLTSAGLTL
jgi:hypothetical protein